MVGIFNNANKVMIGNKEVQSIKIGTSVLYEKSSSGGQQESNILFEDACSSSTNLSKYSSPVNVFQLVTNSSPNLEYNSSNNCYVFTNASSNDWMLYQIPSLDGKSNFTLSMECKIDNKSGPYVGLGVMPNESSLTSVYADLVYSYRYNSSQINCYAQRRRRQTSTNLSTGRVAQAPNSWFKIEMVFDTGTGFTANWKTLSGSVLKTYTGSLSTSVSSRHYGLMLKTSSTSYKVYVRNIKAEKNS